MGDMGELFNDLKAIKRKLRAEIGIECAVCKKARPRNMRPIEIKHAAFEAAGLVKI